MVLLIVLLVLCFSVFKLLLLHYYLMLGILSLMLLVLEKLAVLLC